MSSELQNEQEPEPCTVEQVRSSLEQTEKGKLSNAAANYKRVFQLDPLLKGAIRKNLLTERVDIVKPFGWYRDIPTLTDVDIKYLLLYFEENYGLTIEKKIQDAVIVIATANAKSIEEIKSFLSLQKETYKVPYETHPADLKRQCLFYVTSNTLDSLPFDRTGKRCFVPIMVHPV